MKEDPDWNKVIKLVRKKLVHFQGKYKDSFKSGGQKEMSYNDYIREVDERL